MAKIKKVDEHEPIPALFSQCLEVYDAMTEEATMQQAWLDVEEEFLVYEGFLTRLITHDLHYSNPYYTKITRRLKAMNCIIQVKRGGSTSPSRWALVNTPTLENFKNAIETKALPQSKQETLAQQIRDLSKRLDNAGL